MGDKKAVKVAQAVKDFVLLKKTNVEKAKIALGLKKQMAEKKRLHKEQEEAEVQL